MAVRDPREPHGNRLGVIMGRFTFTADTAGYVGAAGVVDQRVRVASWPINNKNGIRVGPQPPGMKSMIAHFQSVAPAHVADGLIEIVIEDSNHQGGVPIGTYDGNELAATVAAQVNQDTAQTYQRPAQGVMGDFLSIYVTFGTATVDANCTYALPVIQL